MTEAGFDRRPFLLILALAALLRLPTVFLEMFHHPDEIWQYLEPAYGMVTGHSVVTWEYREGMRSWLIPTLLAAPIGLGKAILPGGGLYFPLARFVLMLLSLLIVGVGMAIGRRRSPTHAIVAGLVLATSFELIYFSARALSEALSAACFVPAAWLSLPHAQRDRRRLLLGGLLLGLGVAARVQLAPAAAILALAACGRDMRALAVVIGGGLAGLAVDGVVDALHGQPPLAWMLHNVRLNVVENRSAAYGVEPAGWFLTNQLRIWGWAALPMLGLALLGARRQPILLLVALVNIAVHSLIAHKEYRFILLSVVLLILLAALGTADLIVGARRRWPGRRAMIAAAAGLFWLGASAATSVSPGGKEQWVSNSRSIRLMRAAHAQPGSCGLAFYKPEPHRLAAYYYYDRPETIRFLEDERAFASLRSSVNMVVTARERAAELGPEYHLQACYSSPVRNGTAPPDGRCLFVRAGTCRPSADRTTDINAALIRRGE